MILSWINAMFISYIIQVIIVKPAGRDVLALFFLCFYHFAYVFAFYYMTEGEITDSSNYYNWAVDGWQSGFVGTGFVVTIIQCLRWIGIDQYFLTMLFFAGLSAFGIGAFYSICSRLRRQYFAKKIIGILLLLGLFIPGLHFWTVPVGKDSLILFFYGLILLFVFRGYYDVFVFMCVVFIFLIRPHIGFCILSVFFWYKYFCFSQYMSVVKRITYRSLLMFFSLILAVAFYEGILEYSQKYSSNGFDNIFDFASSRLDIYSETNSGLSSSSFPYIARFFIFYLGGIPWDIHGILQLLSLIEGFVYILLLLLCLRYFLRFINKIMLNRNDNIQTYGKVAFWFFIYTIIVASILSYGSGNLGLIARQRVMIYLPLFMAYLILRHINDRYKVFLE